MKKLLLILSVLVFLQNITNAIDYTSNATGNWNVAATWSPSGIPGAGDNVTIGATHTVTLTQNEVCNDLILPYRSSGTSLAIAANTLSMSGVLTGPRSSTSISTSLITFTTATGKIKFTGAGRTGIGYSGASGTNYWATTITLPNIEVDLSSNSETFTVPTTPQTDLRINSFLLTTGIFDISSGALRVGGGMDGSGDCIISANTIFKCASVRRTSSGITYCNNLTINGTAEVNSTIFNGNTVTINGTLRLKSSTNLSSNPSGSFGLSNFIYGSASKLEYAAPTGNTSFGNEINRDNGSVSAINEMIVNLGDGTKTISSNSKLPQIKFLTFVSGKINLNSLLTVTAGGDITGHSTLRYLIAGASTARLIRAIPASTGSYDFPIGTATDYELATVSFTTAPTAGVLSAFFTTGAPVGGNTFSPTMTVNGLTIANVSPTGSWDISQTGLGASFVYDATLYAYNFKKINGTTLIPTSEMANLVLLKRNTGATFLTDWAGSGSATGAATTATIVSMGLTSFSQFAVGGTASALPITLMNFSANTVNTTNVLNFRTASESNNSHFLIERSANGKDFSEIGRVEGHGTTQTVQNYDFTDKTPLKGYNYYRLKQVDFDQRFEFSKIISVYFGEKNLDVNVSSATNDLIRLAVFSQNEDDATISIVDMNGRIVASQKVVLQEKNNNIDLNTALQNGMYVVKITTANGEQASRILSVK